MSTFSVSYVLKVLAALCMPVRCQDVIAPFFWRKLLDPYRPELYHMRGRDRNGVKSICTTRHARRGLFNDEKS
jgi:hypothetical protein